VHQVEAKSPLWSFLFFSSSQVLHLLYSWTTHVCFFQVCQLSWTLFVDYHLQTTFCFPNFIKHVRLKLRSCSTLCSCSYSLLLRVIKFHCLSSLLCLSSPSNLYNEPRILIRNPKPSNWNPFFLYVDMASCTQTSSQLQVPPLILKVYVYNPQFLSTQCRSRMPKFCC
jgi:hypothetical protein